MLVLAAEYRIRAIRLECEMNKLPRVNTWLLISDGIEGPLGAGFRKAIKHMDCDITDDEIGIIVDSQHTYLMNWFADAFVFDDEDFVDESTDAT